MYDSTSTFKTRRKPHLLLLASLLAILINDVASMAMPINCPEPCECYLNNNGLQSARCSQIFSNQTSFPNIHVLVVRMSEDQHECDIPKDIHLVLPQLYFIYMMNCSLSYIPVETFKELQSLQEIDLSNNLMKKLDSSLFINNPKLVYADLHNNPFRIHDRPFLISKSLRELDLSYCGIKEIPENMFKNLTRLQYLMMNNNKLTSIEENTIPNSVKVMNLNSNLLFRVPIVAIEHLPKLRKIDLSQNPINCTCDQLSFVGSIASNRPLMFDNDVQCMYPRQYRGQSINNVPEQICYDLIGEGVDLPEGDPGDDEGDYSDPLTNQVIPEEKPAKKKDDVQKYFEQDQVVPVDKKANADYNKEEMQSDSISDEGSGNGDGTEIPEIYTSSRDDDETKPTTKSASDNNENNETKPDDTPPEVKQEQTSQPKEPVTEKETEVTSYEHELPVPNEKNDEKVETKVGEPETTPSAAPESEKPKENEPDTESTEALPETTNSESTSEAINPESKTSDSEVSSSAQPNTQETHKPEDTSSAPEVTEPKPSENASSADLDVATEPTKSVENKTSPDVMVTSHAQLQKDNSDSDSSIFNMGYIIPCLAIIIVIIICLGVYLGQRSSHKNWEPNNTTTNNDGAELQDVSLLPDRSKMPIVKNNKKYPAEENSEQTERLMNDGDPSTPKSIWEHLEEPIENGSSKHGTDTQLPNGQSIDKNEPIECAIVKVTTLPDSIPRTPLIRNT